MAINFKNMRSEDAFEEMCRQLVCADYPDAVPVEAMPGDESIDAFEGVIDEDVEHIWQFKHFPHGIGRSQQDQIRRSLVDAVRKHRPKNWTLLTSSDLSPGNLRWLKKQKRDFPDVALDIVSATQIRVLLTKHQAVRKQYFPLQDEKTDALMRLVAGEDAKGRGLPRAAILQNVRNDIRVLNDNSPYFKYTFSFDENGTRVMAEPRIPEAAGMALARVRLEFPLGEAEARDALERYQADVVAGRPVVVPGRYVTVEESVFDEFIGDTPAISELHIIPKLPEVQIPTRIHVSHGELLETVPYVDLRLVRRGKEELEFSNEAQVAIPFRVRATFRREPPGTLEVSLSEVAGMRPSDVIGFERFLEIMGRVGAQVSLESLVSGARITSRIEVAGEELPHGRLRFYEDLLLIESELDPDLVLPDEIEEGDVGAVFGIARAQRTGRATKRGTASVVVVPHDPRQLLELAESGEPLTWVTEDGVETFALFNRVYEFDFNTEMTGPVNVLEEGLPDGGIRVGIEGDINFTYRNGRCLGRRDSL